jgi:hypothetical protein
MEINDGGKYDLTCIEHRTNRRGVFELFSSFENDA